MNLIGTCIPFIWEVVNLEVEYSMQGQRQLDSYIDKRRRCYLGKYHDLTEFASNS